MLDPLLKVASKIAIIFVLKINTDFSFLKVEKPIGGKEKKCVNGPIPYANGEKTLLNQIKGVGIENECNF
jgi:hypothetical protein